VALLAAALADSITFLLLPPGSELNPLAATWPIAALAAKALLVALLLAWRHNYAARVRAFGAAVWTVGALSNIVVIGGL
jgi:hypothetical protein